MNSNVLVTVLAVLAIVIFVFARQIIQRPVTPLSLLLPPMLSAAFAGLFLASHPASQGIVGVMIGAGLGIGTGLFSGQVVGVWRDEATGTVFQAGRWRYALVLIVLLLARVLIRFAFTWSGSARLAVGIPGTSHGGSGTRRHSRPVDTFDR